MTDMRAAALALWDRGWCIMPLRSDGDADNRKRPAIDRWRQYQWVRPTREQVSDWWTEMPDANIAIVTGKVSGLIVVDFDVPEGMVVDPVQFIVDHDLPRDCGLASSGRGFHAFFKHCGGHVPNGVRVGRIGGVPLDLRADGGYIVAAPSLHGNGKRYEWLLDPGELPVLPDAIRKAIEASPDTERSEATTATDFVKSSGELDRLLSGVGEGSRNDSAARLSGYFLKVTKGDRPASWALLKLANSRNKPPLPEGELRSVFGSIERAAQESALDELAEAQDDSHLLVGRAWADAVMDVPPRTGVSAPSLPGLEEMGGLVPKDLIILAGRPGTGKSTASWGVVYDVALRQRVPTVIFSTEMTSVDVARWTCSRMHGEVLSRITRAQWLETLDLISKSPVTICDRGSVTLDYIERVIEHRPETKLVIIDHIQRVSSGKTGGESRNRDLELMASRLKNLAKDRNATVLILSQLNRKSAADNRRPGLTDLRDSGGLEQEADGVFFIWSEAPDPTANPLPVHFYLAKNRHGALREIDAIFYKHLHKFVATDLTHQIAQYQAEAKATEALNNLVRGDHGLDPVRSDPDRLTGDAHEDAALRLLE